MGPSRQLYRPRARCQHSKHLVTKEEKINYSSGVGTEEANRGAA